VGPEERLRAELATHSAANLPLHVHHTDQFIAEGEHPAAALRGKPRASVAVAARLVREGRAEAAVSMGHTGAAMIVAHWILGGIEGVDRPAGGGIPFALAPQTVILDLGPNVDCKPRQFVQFAVLGTAYARCLLGLDSPTVALLANGSEEEKGNRQSQEAYQLLKKSGLNFIGNVEGWDLLSGRANVIVCDGFVGNILLKFGEGLSAALASWLRERLASLLPSTEVQRLTDELQEMMEIEKRIGGGPLLGVKEAGSGKPPHRNHRGRTSQDPIANVKIFDKEELIMQRAVITGLGVITPIGLTVEEFWANLTAGVSGAGPVTAFDTTGFPVRIACEVKGFDPRAYMDFKLVQRTCRATQFAIAK